MKRKISLTLLFLFTLIIAEAKHIAGGEMSYKYLGPGTGTNLRYQITLKLYRDCFAPDNAAQLDDAAAITIFENGREITTLTVKMAKMDVVSLSNPGPCIDNPPQVCYQIGYYYQDVELPISAVGYTIAYQRCCRIDNIANIVGSVNAGSTYMATIPGTNILVDAPVNSSPVFNTMDTVLICENNPFMYNFSATDIDGDQLEYTFQDAYGGASTSSPRPASATAPPYSSLLYNFNFSATAPMGKTVSINANSGWVSGVAPTAGIYVITVVVIERRRGVIINLHRKDLHLKVAACSIAKANLNPQYITCNGFELTFQNLNVSNLIKSYFWDFGIPGNTDTTSIDRPTFKFPDTGQFKVMLITNRGQECSDTAFTVAKIYPGFFPNFTADNSCKNAPMQFYDKSTTNYGTVNSWKWFFGYPNINPDTSRLQNPKYSYPQLNTYNVQLIVGNSKGCIDTIENQVTVLDKPTLRVSNDTLICNIDTLQLHANGNGTFTWTPNYMINNTNIPDPLVSPDIPTMYYITLTSAPGCSNIDSVFVDVKQFVSVFAGNDTSICLTDSVRFNPVTDATSFIWTPSAGLNSSTIKRPSVKPNGTTTYTLIANIGKCQASDSITVFTFPYPKTNINKDTTLCFGDATQLAAFGGTQYLWMPAAGLNNNRIANPIATPKYTTKYKVAVFDPGGCPKPAYDSVLIRVIPKILAFAGRDTAIVINQPLQLNASGGTIYQWLPSLGLSDPNINNPIATLSSDYTYYLRVSSIEGCAALDTINIHVFQTNTDIFVPTAFTPNNDKLNDFLVPLPVGIEQFDFFKVYNRFGQLVFSTTEVGKGWDGKIEGKEQSTATFVWYVQGTDYTGKKIFKKGTSTLIK